MISNMITALKEIQKKPAIRMNGMYIHDRSRPMPHRSFVTYINSSMDKTDRFFTMK